MWVLRDGGGYDHYLKVIFLGGGHLDKWSIEKAFLIKNENKIDWEGFRGRKRDKVI